MLGHYRNFPETIHGFARFTYKASQQNVQHAILTAFHHLSQRERMLEEIVPSSRSNCEVKFEFGIGEDVTFTFLDKKELERLEAEIANKDLTLLDFLCALQYHVVDKSGKHAPLKFDYYLLRFTFNKNSMEFLVSHERGPQRVHVEDLIDILTQNISKELTAHYFVVLKLESSQRG